jgi:hypothetical protein
MVSRAKERDEHPSFINRQLARALVDPLRARILVELNKRTMSSSEFANEFGHPLPKISRKFRELAKFECIELVEERRGEGRRGGVERFFRATKPAMIAIALQKTRTGGARFDDSSWAKLPPSVRTGFSGVIFETYLERVAQAMEAGTLDARGERHFTWTAHTYDQQAWEEIIERLDELFMRAQELETEAAIRMAESGATPIPVTVALAGFESPKSEASAD